MAVHTAQEYVVNPSLVDRQVVADIRGVLSRIAHLTHCLHVSTRGRVVLGHFALLVPAERVPSQIRECGIKAIASFLFILTRCLRSHEVISATATIQRVAAEERKLWGETLRMARTGWSEAVMTWVHMLVVRVFVETVLRYGLPLDFVCGMLTVGNSSK